ncbi:MAG: hypothetical protein HY598_03190, partial [Candidatus Omnitrophica bacterium]|nr:hypothetical protein [Candidatus Omnitrophota bacterium]
MQRSTERGLIVLLLCLTAVYAIAEEVTLTTYYPSPRGVYDQLRTMNQTTLAETGGNVGIGTTNPLSPLDVAKGPVTIRDGGFSGEGAGLFLGYDSTAGSSIILSNDFAGEQKDLLVLGRQILMSVDGGGGPGGLILTPTGDVGIGTTTPQTRLALNRGVGGSDIGITQQQVGGA